MKLLAFAGSNSSTSINKALATLAANTYRDQVNTAVEIEIIDLNDYEMPIYSSDREAAGGIPDLAHALRDKIGAADALIISHAEHNGAMTAAWKNIFDWMSRIDTGVYQGTPSVMLATSPGPGGAARVLDFVVNAAPHFAGDVKGSLSIANFYDNFDMETGTISNAEIAADLLTQLKAL